MTELLAPLVPLDCDLRGLPWMPLDTVRLMDSDLFAVATGDAFKAAVALWCKAWQQVPAASLPHDERILASLSGAGSKWKRVREEALRGFVLCSDGRLYHPVIAEKALEAWKHRQAQRDRASKRWHGSGNATAHAVAYPAAMQGTGTGQDQKPVKGGKPPPPDGFEIVWKAYPKRAGNNPKGAAERAYRARITAGIKPAEILDGVGRYARFCEAKGKIGTEFVMRASTFLGPDEPFAQDWSIQNGGGDWRKSPETMLAKANELGIATRGLDTRQLQQEIETRLSR